MIGDRGGSRLEQARHVVRLYRTEEELIGSVTSYLADGLRDERPAVAIAMRSHVEVFKSRLAGAAIEASDTANVPCIVLDAEATLARFMIDGRPDPASFDATVGTAIRSLAAAGGPPVAFGEMVAILWEAGNVTGALELETLWNDLLAEEDFSLYCAYPIDILEDAGRDQLVHMCELHTDIFGEPLPPGSAPEDREVVRTLACSVDTPRKARRLLEQTLNAWGLSALIPDASLVVSELATNAIVHAGTYLEVTLTREPAALRVAVADGGPPLPEGHPAPPRPIATSGRGLYIIQSIAQRWGSDPTPNGKRVWAELPASQAEREAGSEA